MPPVLDARRVGKVFGGGLLGGRPRVALEDLSLAIGGDRPSVTAIAGESGSGKTTLARLLLGMLSPTRGAVSYRGTDLRALGRAEWRAFRREVQAIFQDPFEAYNPFYRVDHVLTTPVARFGLAASGGPARALIETALQAVGLRPEETLGRYPHQLSGGQRQRVMVARAILLRPRVILADEPVSMVDASLRATILESLVTLRQTMGISLVYITHDLTTAYQVSEDILVLYRGSVAEAGDVERVIRDPQHPYTQLLVRSIPLPSPDRQWGRPEPVPAERGEGGGAGCRFAGRCPAVMERCRRAPPPLFGTEPARAVACYLYEGAPVVEAGAALRGAGAGPAPPAAGVAAALRPTRSPRP
jgi:oligopeptide/dipeptide ABC transporter ATP-binding protein